MPGLKRVGLPPHPRPLRQTALLYVKKVLSELRKTILHNDNIAWQGQVPHNRLGETAEGRATMVSECIQPPVGWLLGCCSVRIGAPRISRGVQIYGIHVSGCLDGYVADGDLACPAS